MAIRSPLTIEEVPPGSVLRQKGQMAYFAPVAVLLSGVRFVVSVDDSVLLGRTRLAFYEVSYAELADGWEICRPGEDWTAANQLLCELPSDHA